MIALWMVMSDIWSPSIEVTGDHDLKQLNMYISWNYSSMTRWTQVTTEFREDAFKIGFNGCVDYILFCTVVGTLLNSIFASLEMVGPPPACTRWVSSQEKNILRSRLEVSMWTQLFASGSLALTFFSLPMTTSARITIWEWITFRGQSLATMVKKDSGDDMLTVIGRTPCGIEFLKQVWLQRSVGCDSCSK